MECGRGRCTTHYLQKFRLYETRSKFYMIGRDKSRTFWKVLTIDRVDPTKLNIREDSAIYTEAECCDLLTRIHEGNRGVGGIRFVTSYYGIIGFIKFLGPYYMLLITKRRKIGGIGVHTIYAIVKTQMITLSNTTGSTNATHSKIDNSNSIASMGRPISLLSVNVTVGEKEERNMMTGLHTVADIFCVGCGSIVGWKYEAAQDKNQRYKVGKFILERFKVSGPDGTNYWANHEAQGVAGSDADDA